MVVIFLIYLYNEGTDFFRNNTGGKEICLEITM